MRKIILFSFLIALLSISNLMSQTTRYVDPSGSYGGNTPCYATIQLAVAASVAGDNIQVNPGVYTGNITVNKNNITLTSRDGAATTYIYGNNAGSYTGTVFLPTGSSGIRIGSIGHGFTIIGLNGGPALEKTAIYLQGTQTNITIEDNVLQANGCEALIGEYNANDNNITINKNHFTGQTFFGTPSSSSSDTNTAMQAVVFGGGASTTNTKNFTFTNNQISTICGSGSRGNCLVTLDLVGTNVITGNTFDGTIGTSLSAYALRVRGSGTYTVQNNVFSGSFSYALSSQNNLVGLNNYWGSAKGPNASGNACPGSKYISSNVTYEPWYNDANLTTLVYKLAPFTVSGAAGLCPGSSTNIALSGSQNGSNYQYQLYNGAATVGSAVSGSGSALSIPTTLTGTHTIKVTNSLNTCQLTMTGSAIITAKIRPTANITGGSNTTVVLATTGTGPWSGTLSDGTPFSGSTSPITVTVAPIATTTYTVATLLDANCTSVAGDLTGSYTINTKIETPLISLASGTYVNAQSITLSCATSGATLRYTTDGSTPNELNGTTYAGAFTILSTATLKVIAYKSSWIESDLAIASYIINIDTDNDGVLDGDDAYPNDPTRAFDNYYPATGNGTLVFEDSWPAKGDYDMNDVVVDYRYKNVLNSSNQLVETFATFTLKATGASFENGFGFQLASNDIPSSALQVTGYNMHENYLMLGANGTENNQNKPTIIVFDNAYKVFQQNVLGTGYNTTPGATYVTPVTITLHITYTANTYSLQQLDLSHFNPFIIINKQRTKEVHLPDYAPTALANTSLLGTVADNSIPAQGRYYKTAANLPWALNLYNGFSYPNEKAEVTKAYLHFIDWVVSNGTLYQDWYSNTAEGYRNASYIYVAGKK